ncbi:hypothetical protein T10_10257 [Trichinella papuae]|uniref:Uncharacterized protein n=1 Tax=Trichinella papuae TaxID=268474 RepID=A0A0V1MGN9_9BILA|nr:hypothetical protein T10_10257 [Trichinella papuae]
MHLTDTDPLQESSMSCPEKMPMVRTKDANYCVPEFENVSCIQYALI